MALEIIWSPNAIEGANEIIDYIHKHFTQKEVNSFLNDLEDFLNILIFQPKLLQASRTYVDIYRGPINSKTILTYKLVESEKRIYLLDICSARGNREKI